MTDHWIGPQLKVMIILLFTFLLAFQFLGLAFRKHSHPFWKNYCERIQSTWFIFLPLTAALVWGPLSLVLLWCAVASLVVYEMLQAKKLETIDKKLENFLITSPWILAFGLWLGFPWFWVTSFLLLPAPIFMLIQGSTNKFLERLSYVQWILVQIVVALSFGMLLIDESPGATQEMGKAGIFAWALLVTQLHDAMQYGFGKCIGKHSILPQISPQKTWEGLVCGLFVTSFIASFVLAGESFSFHEAFFISAIVCLSGFFSDVMMSAIKRGIGIKDYGSILKGHGGLLDRIDSLLLALPVAYFLLTFIS